MMYDIGLLVVCVSPQVRQKSQVHLVAASTDQLDRLKQNIRGGGWDILMLILPSALWCYHEWWLIEFLHAIAISYCCPWLDVICLPNTVVDRWVTLPLIPIACLCIWYLDQGEWYVCRLFVLLNEADVKIELLTWIINIPTVSSTKESDSKEVSFVSYPP